MKKQRLQLTIIFTDIVNSTPCSARAFAYDGHEVTQTGDGFFTVFEQPLGPPPHEPAWVTGAVRARVVYADRTVSADVTAGRYTSMQTGTPACPPGRVRRSASLRRN